MCIDMYMYMFFKFSFKKCISVFLIIFGCAVLRLCCFAWAFWCGKWVYSLAVVRGLLIAVVSLVAEHGL